MHDRELCWLQEGDIFTGRKEQNLKQICKLFKNSLNITMKTNLLFKLMIFAGVLFAAGCDNPTGEKAATYTLSCDKTSVTVGEEVTFTVKSDADEDVTAEWNFYQGETQLPGNKAKWSEPASYTVTARSKTDASLETENSVTVTVTAEPAETTYTLSSDKTKVNINEVVTFTITSSTGEDVTAEWDICDKDNCYIGNKLSWDKSGTHILTAHNRANPDIETENSVTVEVGGSVYRLSADTQKVYVLETVNFTVKEVIDGIEQDKAVQGFSIGIKDGEKFSSSSHIFTKAGVYTVEAKQYDYKGELRKSCENTLEIIVKDREIIGHEDNFYRRSLLSEATATSCWTCPSMAKAIDYVMEYLLPDRIVPVAFHMKGDACDVKFKDQFDIILADYKFYSYPVFIIDWNKTYAKDDSMMNLQEGAPKIVNAVEASQARYESAKTPGLAIETSLSGRDLSIKIKTTPRETGDYLLGVYFIEDGVETEQTSGENGRMVQMNVVHQCLTTGANNNKLDELGTLEAEQEYTFDYAMTIPARHNMDNCRIVYYICKTDATVEPYGYYCANATTVKVGESADYEYEPIFAEPE